MWATKLQRSKQQQHCIGVGSSFQRYDILLSLAAVLDFALQ
jgi:hypothetical protein